MSHADGGQNAVASTGVLAADRTYENLISRSYQIPVQRGFCAGTLHQRILSSIGSAQQHANTPALLFQCASRTFRKAAGITFIRTHANRREILFRDMGTGVAWIDYDQDGLMDLYFVQSGAPTHIRRPSHCARLSIITTATERLPMLLQRQAWERGALRPRSRRGRLRQ